MVHENISIELNGYENSLVKQFRTIEALMTISKKERDLILHGPPDSLMKITEEKEAAIDKFTLLEENSRMFLQKIALKLNIQAERTNVKDILPFLDENDTARIQRLLDGISTLVTLAKDINLGNQALVLTRMEWLRATQSFVTSLVPPENTYTLPLAMGGKRKRPVSSLEFQA